MCGHVNVNHPSFIAGFRNTNGRLKVCQLPVYFSKLPFMGKRYLIIGCMPCSDDLIPLKGGKFNLQQLKIKHLLQASQSAFIAMFCKILYSFETEAAMETPGMEDLSCNWVIHPQPLMLLASLYVPPRENVTRGGMTFKFSLAKNVSPSVQSVPWPIKYLSYHVIISTMLIGLLHFWLVRVFVRWVVHKIDWSVDSPMFIDENNWYAMRVCVVQHLDTWLLL